MVIVYSTRTSKLRHKMVELQSHILLGHLQEAKAAACTKNGNVKSYVEFALTSHSF